MGSIDETLYNCYFCKQNIKRSFIEEHFKIIHNFESSDQICQVCENSFENKNDLTEHVQNVHVDNEQIQNQPKAKMDSFEEGKSKFLHFMANFKSLDDALKILDWVSNENLEELRLFIQDDFEKNCHNNTEKSQEMVNDEHVLDQKINENKADHSLNKRDFENVELDLESSNDFDFIDDIEKESTDADEFENEQASSFTMSNMNFQTKIEILAENPSKVDEIDDKRELNSLLNYVLESDNEDSEERIEKEYSCGLCSKLLSSEKQLKNHMIQNQCQEYAQITDNDDSLKCHLCEKSFRTAQYKGRHIRRVHADCKNYICADCGKAFLMPSILKSHCDSVHKILKDFLCPTCGKEFNVESKLKRHLTVHEDQKRHQCSSCSKSYSLPKQLADHINYAHKFQKNYKCDICGKLFAKRSSEYKHIKIAHHGQDQGYKRYNCDHENCKKSFTEKSSLKLHIYTVHEGHKDYACNTCGKSFAQKSGLKTHFRGVHATYKDYKCYACGENFSKGIDFKRHIFEVHEGPNGNKSQ